jgi:hypothetical protein
LFQCGLRSGVRKKSAHKRDEEVFESIMAPIDESSEKTLKSMSQRKDTATATPAGHERKGQTIANGHRDFPLFLGEVHSVLQNGENSEPCGCPRFSGMKSRQTNIVRTVLISDEVLICLLSLFLFLLDVSPFCSSDFFGRVFIQFNFLGKNLFQEGLSHRPRTIVLFLSFLRDRAHSQSTKAARESHGF